MSRKPASDELTEAQRKRFTENFRYMWDVLETSYYYVVGSYEKEDSVQKRRGISNDMGYLPVYSVCSGYYNGRKYPDRGRLGKLVMFYNQYISPEITAADFLDTDLSRTGAKRIVESGCADRRFEGMYYGYYQPSSGMRVCGACLFLKTDTRNPSFPHMKAALISGFRSDSEMNCTAVRKLDESDTVPDFRAYREYFEALPADKRRTCFFEGTAEMSPHSAVISLKGADNEFRRVMIVLNTRSFPATYRFARSYDGGFGFALSSGSPGSDPRFFRLGLARSDQPYISLLDEKLKGFLGPCGKDDQLSPDRDGSWIDYVWERK